MANTVDNVRINFEVEGEDDLKSSQVSLEELSGSILGITGIAAGAGIAIAGIGVAAVGVFTIDSIKLADEFANAMNNLQTQTGATSGEMEELKTAVENIYFDNYGESIEDVADSMALVKQNAISMGIDSASQIEEMTKNAIIMRDAFKVDVNETLRGATSLITNFGVTGEESFNLMAQGIQNGVNKNEDMMDILNEYGPQFKALGFSAENFMNTLIAGADTGAWSIDKVGDAVKEFNIRAKDGSDTTKAAFEALGLNADEMTRKFSEGGEEAYSAFEEVNSRLLEMDDLVLQNQTGVSLWGTMWEDLEVDGIASLTSIIDVADKSKNTLEEIDNIQYNSLDSSLEGLKRKFEKLKLSIGEKFQPALMDLANYIHSNVVPAIEYLVSGDEGSLNSIGNMSDTTKQRLEKLREKFEVLANYIKDDLGNAFMYLATGDDSYLGKTQNMSDTTKQRLGKLREMFEVLANYIKDDLGNAFMYLATGDDSYLGKTQNMTDNTKDEFVELRREGIEPVIESIGEWGEELDDFDAKDFIKEINKMIEEIMNLVNFVKDAIYYINELQKYNIGKIIIDVVGKTVISSSEKEEKQFYGETTDYDRLKQQQAEMKINKYYGTGIVPQMAGGGIADEGWTLVGELGPELRYLNAGDRIFSNNESKEMLNTSPNTLPNNIDVNLSGDVNLKLDDKTITLNAEQIKDVIAQLLNNSMNRFM